MPTYDEVSGLKYFDILPTCSVYKMRKSYGVSMSWLVFEIIINYGKN